MIRTPYTPFVVNETGANDHTTGTYTFPAGSLVVIKVVAQSNGSSLTATNFAIDDAGADLTWSYQVGSDSGAVDYGTACAIFTAVGNGTPCTITITNAVSQLYNLRVYPYSYTGFDALSPIGVTLAVNGGPTDGAWAPNLSGVPAASSEILGMICGPLNSGTPTIDQGSGGAYTELWDAGLTDWYWSEGEVRTGSTSQAFGWTDVIVGGGGYYHATHAVAIEIKAAAGGAAVTGTGAMTAPAATVAGSGTRSAISYVSNGSVAIADNASVSPGFGSTTQTNDIGLVIGGLTTGTTGRTLGCSGYTQVDAYTPSQQQPLYVWAKLLGASESAPTVTVSGGAAGNVLQAVSIVLRNARQDPSSLLHAVQHQATLNADDGNPIGTPALTVTEDDCTLMLVVNYQTSTTSLGTFNPGGDGAWTQKVFSSTTTGSDQTLAVYIKHQKAAANVATGTLAISGATANGTARVSLFAIRANGGPIDLSTSAAVSAAVATVAGSGVVHRTGTGAVSIGKSTVEGSGVIHRTGAGALQVSVATVSGAGEKNSGPESLAGSGSPQATSATAAGTGHRGAMDLPGAVALTGSAPTVSGTGTVVPAGAPQSVTGSGALAVGKSTVAGSGVRHITGTGSLGPTPPSLSAAGVRHVTGSGALVVGAATIAGGQGPKAVAGTGSITASAAAVAGSSVRRLSALGDLAAPRPSASGPGVRRVVAVGAITVPGASVSGGGVRHITGSGALVVRVARVRGGVPTVSDDSAMAVELAAPMTKPMTHRVL